MAVDNTDFISTAHLLTKLAILKSKVVEEQAIALMAKYLLTKLTFKDIQRCCTYFAERKTGFPEPSEYFSHICPAKTIDEVAETEIAGILESVRNGAYNKASFSETQLDLLEKWNWSRLAQMKQGDLDKARVNMLFYLKAKLGTDGKTKENLSKEAFLQYREEQKQLEQGEINAIEEKFM